MPIDQFCIAVVDRLKKLNWKGNLILEYLPWHHYRVRGDIKVLSNWLKNGIPVEILSFDDRYRNNPERWGYGEDGR